MPPAISDEENSASEEEIPFRKAMGKEVANPAAANDEVEDDDSESVENAEEYIVEKIVDHAFEDDGTIRYRIKWQGYEKKADQTWEPEENLTGAQDVLEEYFRKIGGRPEYVPPQQKKRKNQNISGSAQGTRRGKRPKQEDDDDAASSDSKRVRATKWEPPKGSWEEDVISVDTVEEQPILATGGKERFALIVWKNGKRTTHPLKVVNQKCPQRMLQYYEQHLVFKTSSPDEVKSETNGEVEESQ